jgi:hypothetical protein
MAAGLVGIHSKRVIALSGTPYNNNCQDIATLMSYIDPMQRSAVLKFWENATGNYTCSNRVKINLREWTNKYLVRREKDVIEHKLTKKEIRNVAIIEKESVMQM